MPETSTGVYLVSLTASPDTVDVSHLDPPLSDAALDKLNSACPALTLDGQSSPTREQLAKRIGSFWLPDECVLYIGLAGQPLRTRVRQYYRTPLGAAKPHKGGWWLKTLSVLDDLHVHYAATPDFKDAEEGMLRAFAANASGASRARIPEGERVTPFANLRDADWRRRNHGIANATSDIAARGAAGPSAEPTSASEGMSAAKPRSRIARDEMTATPHYRTQNVTAKDVEAGQVRIPRGPTKAILPENRSDIVVALRGRALTCRWDPRYGPPERSGVIRVGKAAAAELLDVGDVLAVGVSDDAVVELQ